MLPVWQAEFGLGFAALGAVATVFSGTMAALQVPASMLAERYGAPIVLALGTALAGLGYCLAGAEQRRRHPGRRLVHRRARRFDAAPAGLVADHPRFPRQAVDEGDRHL